MYMYILAQIWAKGQKPSTAPLGDLECNYESWGIGAQATTKLLNQENEVSASASFTLFC